MPRDDFRDSRAQVADIIPALDWVLEVVQASLSQDDSRALDSGHHERLSRILTASNQRLEAAMGTLLVPRLRLRVTHSTGGSLEREPQEILSAIEARVLELLRRGKQHVLVKTAPATGFSLSGFRLLAVPLTGTAAGALIFVRPFAAPQFTHTHVLLARHLGGHLATLLEAESDPATGLYSSLGVRTFIAGFSGDGPQSPGVHSLIDIGVDGLHAPTVSGGSDGAEPVLLQVARLLREPDLPPPAMAARLGRREFLIVAPHMPPETAAELARSVQQRAARLTSGSPSETTPSLSCGISAFDSLREFADALARAELARQMASRHGPGCVEVYRGESTSMIRRRADFRGIRELRDAMSENRLALFAQPIVPLSDKSPAGRGYELLLRMADQLHVNQAPTALITAALHHQLSAELDLWVIEHAIAEAMPFGSDLRAAGLSLSINIAGPSLTDKSFQHGVRSLLQSSQVSPRAIVFEITETAAVNNLSRAVRFIQELRQRGCRFALDDFGTGVNSLKNLTILPVDRVKIDGSFVRNVLTDHQSQAAVRAIVNLARELGMNTVAEYAENRQIIQKLADLGVDCAQGYAVGKPRPFGEALRDLSAGHDEFRAIATALAKGTHPSDDSDT